MPSCCAKARTAVFPPFSYRETALSYCSGLAFVRYSILGVAYWMDVIPATIIFSVHHNGMSVHDSFESLFGIDLDLLQLGKLHLQIGNLINAETFCGFNDLFFIHINLMLQAWIQLLI